MGFLSSSLPPLSNPPVHCILHPKSTQWHGTPDNYTTAVVGNLSIAWIRKVVAESRDRPFFAYVAPKAAHEPFNPAPWYTDFF